jgi:hypothetical protein
MENEPQDAQTLLEAYAADIRATELAAINKIKTASDKWIAENLLPNWEATA